MPLAPTPRMPAGKEIVFLCPRSVTAWSGERSQGPPGAVQLRGSRRVEEGYGGRVASQRRDAGFRARPFRTR